jgi:hypothetical protein
MSRGIICGRNVQERFVSGGNCPEGIVHEKIVWESLVIGGIVPGGICTIGGIVQGDLSLYCQKRQN